MEVESADGIVHEFPDGTDQSVIDQAMEGYAKSQQVTPGGLLKSVGAGAVKGTGEILGSLGDFRHFVGSHLPDSIKDTLKSDKGALGSITRATAVAPTSETVNKTLGTAVGGLHEAQNPSEKIAESAGSFLPTMMAGPEAFAAKGAGLAAKGANTLIRGASALGTGAASEALGQQADKFSPAVGNATRFATALFAPTVGRKLITPAGAADPQRLAQGKVLEGEGISGLKPTAGEKTGYAPQLERENRLLPNRESESQAGFNEAVARRAGMPGDEISQRTLGTNTRETKQAFDDLAARNDMHPSHAGNLRNDVANIGVTNDKVITQADRIDKAITPTGLSGADYKDLRSDLSKEAYGSKGVEKRGLHDLIDALDTHMEASIGQHNPADSGAWSAARERFQANQALINAATPEGLARGTITPKQMAKGLQTTYGKTKAKTGQTPFSGVTDAAIGAFDRSAGKSTSAEQSGLTKAGSVLGTGAGILNAGYHMMTGHGAPSLGGAGAEVMSPVGGHYAGLGAEYFRRALMGTGADRALVTGPGQMYMGNQILPHDRNKKLGYMLRALAERNNYNTPPTGVDVDVKPFGQ